MDKINVQSARALRQAFKDATDKPEPEPDSEGMVLKCDFVEIRSRPGRAIKDPFSLCLLQDGEIAAWADITPGVLKRLMREAQAVKTIRCGSNDGHRRSMA